MGHVSDILPYIGALIIPTHLEAPQHLGTNQYKKHIVKPLRFQQPEESVRTIAVEQKRLIFASEFICTARQNQQSLIYSTVTHFWP
jgi:hypothetical protein